MIGDYLRLQMQRVMILRVGGGGCHHVAGDIQNQVVVPFEDPGQFFVVIERGPDAIGNLIKPEHAFLSRLGRSPEFQRIAITGSRIVLDIDVG